MAPGGAGADGEGSGSGYRLSDRLVLTARHVIAPALARAGGRLLVRPVGVTGWLPARVEWEDADADAALILIEGEHWRAPAGESVLRWGELTGSDPVPCAAVGFPWASTRPDRMRDAAHLLYGHLAPLGQLRQGRLDLDVASASPSARPDGSPWAGISGAGVITDNHLVGVITVDPARYQGRLVAVPAAGCSPTQVSGPGSPTMRYRPMPCRSEPAVICGGPLATSAEMRRTRGGGGAPSLPDRDPFARHTGWELHQLGPELLSVTPAAR